MAKETLAEILAENTKEGILYEKMPDGKIRCFACGHRCPIPEGKAGVCRVRFNEGGKLYVPTGYVGALQDDPIEKKPFFHALPGARALSFGMLGCDFHCGYCFTAGTRIATSSGVIPIGDIVSKKIPLEIYDHRGKKTKIKTFFKRPYAGPILKIKPAFLPEVECTPGHPFFVRKRPDRFPHDTPGFIEARFLTRDHCLAVPKKYEFSEDVVFKTREHLEPLTAVFRVPRTIPAETVKQIIHLTREGKGSREISALIGKSASHVRHLRSQAAGGKRDFSDSYYKKMILIEENDKLRFSKEHAPGIPVKIPFNEELAELLGFYCAEGSVSKNKGRVLSATLNFAFSPKEADKVNRVRSLIRKIFGIKTYAVKRQTTLAAAVNQASLALFFKSVCGSRGSAKHVPGELFRAKRNVVRAFLDAYVAGDGHRAPDGQVRISTISEELAWGVAWLVQKSGYLPQFYRYQTPVERQILGRQIRQAPWIYLVRWHEQPKRQRHLWEDENYRYVLIEKISSRPHQGNVYNLETAWNHSYLANFVAVHNCQNWVTSQALRDPAAVSPPIKTGPEELVEIALKRECEVLASTYNEPLITSEWAVEIFQEARKAGLVTAYISNGNATPQVLDFIRPWVDLYKVDLKSFDDRHYRELGGTLENVKRTIRDLYERKFWLEVLTLLIPGFNSSDEEIRKLTEFLVSVSPDIPWHVTAFHKDYKMTGNDNTTARDLMRAAEIGKKSGLHYIYAGNLPGMAGDWENTYCPDCRTLLIERYGFQILQDKLTPSGGLCVKCKKPIPGFWKKEMPPRKSDAHVKSVF